MAAVLTDGRPATVDDTASLLEGYAGPAHRWWVDGRAAVSCAGSAELEVVDDLVVAVDGRLDNRRDVARLVGAAGTASTARLVAECWRRLGAAAVDRLVGDLAGVVIHRRSLIVSAFRDLCGGRPLHVTRTPEAWCAATEWQPLLRTTTTSPRPNPEWFAAGFVGHSLEPRATPYQDVDVVLPGHVASPSSQGWLQSRQADWEVPTLRDHRPGVYAEQFQALFDQAVRDRIGDQSGFGVTLSGGLDSTSVLATAHALHPKVGRSALCLAFTDPAADERSVQAYMAERCETPLHWVNIDGLSPFGPAGPEGVFARFGAPPLVINWFYGDVLAEAARSANVSVVLDGEDGDGSVGGSNTYLADLIVTGRWRRWLAEVNSMRRLGAAAGREMLNQSLTLAMPPAIRRLYLRQTGGRYTPELLAPSLTHRLDLEHRLGRGFLNEQWSPGRMFAAAQRAVGSVEHVAPKYTTISEPWRRRGIELSHPWADRRLMSFCMGLPYVHVRARALPKIVLRQAMADRLPPFLLAHNGKADLSEVVNRAMTGPERTIVMEGLALARTQPEWFSATAVTQLEKDLGAGKSFSMATRTAMFARWLRWCDVS